MGLGRVTPKDLGQQLLLALDVAVEAAREDADLTGDVAHARAVIALLAEQVRGDADDEAPRGAIRFARSWRSTQRGLTGREGGAERDDDGLVGAALVLNRYGVMSM